MLFCTRLTHMVAVTYYRRDSSAQITTIEGDEDLRYEEKAIVITIC